MINILVFNVSLVEGMASSMRVKNLLSPLLDHKLIIVNNLVLSSIYENDKIDKNGTIDDMDYLYTGYKSPYNLSAVFNFYRNGFRFISSHKKKDLKNVFYSYGYPDIKNIWFLLFAKLKGYKIIFDIVEDNRTAHQFSSLKGRIRNRTSLFFIKLTPYIADTVFAISQHLKKRMDEICKEKIPVILIPITVDFKYFTGVYKSRKSDGVISIFYGGSYADKDGLEYLIKAFKIVAGQYDNLRLILTGKGQPGDMKKILGLADGDSKIIFKGFLDTDEYYNTLNSCEICCMTRNNSAFANAGFPFKLGEFLAAGKAIIASSVGDVPFYLSNKKNAILISPESVSDIVAAMQLCIENRDGIREHIGLEARKTAETFFDSSKISLYIFEAMNK
jgi:glycosyltransferase involved in cell wall biosynthesis